MGWADTRDVSADGLAKGAVEHTALRQLMDGRMIIEREMKLWSRKLLSPGRTSTEISHFCSRLCLFSFAPPDHLVQEAGRPDIAVAMPSDKITGTAGRPATGTGWSPTLPDPPPLPPVLAKAMPQPVPQ
jgi:hypothetical protein